MLVKQSGVMVDAGQSEHLKIQARDPKVDSVSDKECEAVTDIRHNFNVQVTSVRLVSLKRLRATGVIWCYINETVLT